MADTTILQVKLRDTEWKDTISVKLTDRLALEYKILDPKTLVRFIIPIYLEVEDEYQKYVIPAQQAFMNENDWANIEVILTDTNLNITPNKILLGIYEFQINEDVSEFPFKLGKAFLSFQEFVQANISLEVYDTEDYYWKEVSSITICKSVEEEVPEPIISEFIAEKYLLVSGESTTLSWSIDDCDKLELYRNGLDKPVMSWQKASNTSSVFPKQHTVTVNGDTQEYILKAYNKEKVANLPIYLRSYTKTGISVVGSGLFEGGRLMGIYTDGRDRKLYALVEAFDTPKKEVIDVFLWESVDGFKWEKTVDGSKYVAFNSPYNEGGLRVPLSFAESPGVFYKNKLYLIGGSRFNPDITSNEVYFYEFLSSSENSTQQKGWQKRNNADFFPRMGHSCIVHECNIWVIGGCTSGEYTGGAGSKKEIWSFNGDEWTELKALSLMERNSMASVISYKAQLQIFGGFGKLPGKADKDLGNTYYLNNKDWVKQSLSSNLLDGNKFSACEVAVLGKDRFVFCCMSGDESSFVHKCLKITENHTISEVIPAGDWLMNDLYYHIQAVTFKGVIWFCCVTQDGDIKSNLLQYLFHVAKT